MTGMRFVTDEDLATACAAADISIKDLRHRSRQVDLVARRNFVVFQLDALRYTHQAIGQVIARDRTSVICALRDPVTQAPPPRADIDAMVKGMWEGNHTASVIAERVKSVTGLNFSRDAVLGLVDRRGWKATDPAVKVKDAAAKVTERKPSPNFWTPEARARIKAAYLMAVNAKEVADALNGKLDGGRELTRVQVIGMAFRYKWPRPAKMAVPRGRAPRVAAQAKRPFALATTGPNRPPSKPGQAVPALNAVAAGEGLDLVDLADNGCRNIIGQWGGAARYCGAACAERPQRRPGSSRYRSYCQGCAATLGNVEKPLAKALRKDDRAFLEAQCGRLDERRRGQ